MAVGIYVLHLHPGEEEIRRTFLREAAEYVDPVRCKKVQRLKSTGAKAASLGAGMLLQKMALDLIDGTENTGILFLEEDELLAVLQERMHRDKAGALSFSYEYGELGKPQIVNIPKKFNLSHSGDYVVCAVSTSNRWTLWGSKATRTVSPLRALEVGATRAVILLPLYSRYR